MFMVIMVLVLTSCKNKKVVYSDKEINTERLEQTLNNYSEVTHVFFFSRDDCQSCIDSIDSLNYISKELIENRPNDKIYYFNYYDTYKNRQDENFEKTLDSLGIVTVPTIIIYDYEKELNNIIDDIEVIQDKEILLKEVLKILE